MFLFVVGRWSLSLSLSLLLLLLLAASLPWRAASCLGWRMFLLCHVLSGNCLNPTESILLRKMQQTAKKNIILVYLGHSARCLLRSCPASWWLGPGLRATAIGGSFGLSQKFEKLNVACFIIRIRWKLQFFIYPRFRQTLIFVRFFLNTNERMSQSGWLCDKYWECRLNCLHMSKMFRNTWFQIQPFAAIFFVHWFINVCFNNFDISQVILGPVQDVKEFAKVSSRIWGPRQIWRLLLDSDRPLGDVLSLRIIPFIAAVNRHSEWSATVQKQNLILPRFASLIVALCCVYTPLESI